MSRSREDGSRFARPLLAAVACGLALAVGSGGATAAARTSDKPTAGSFAGQSSFDGPVKLRFQRSPGIGLHVGRYTIKGTVRCSDDERIPFAFSGNVTARTAAKVRKDRSFRLNLAGLRVTGRFASSKRVTGKLTVTTLSCSKTGNFSASRAR